MLDFTLQSYKNLFNGFMKHNYKIVFFAKYLNCVLNDDNTKMLIIRHDVDRLPQNAIKMAQLEHDLGIQSTYYFRIIDECFDKNIIGQIAELGHEIGYHYEDIDLVQRDLKKQGKSVTLDELIDRAMESFLGNLEKFRKIYPVQTICMHGSPLSKYDNRMLWDKYDYRDYGIIGEPYIDIDFNKVAYYTDTGRSWAGEKLSIRDKVNIEKQNGNNNILGQCIETKFPTYKSTGEIIEAISNDTFPKQAMLTVHPQRWHDKPWPWLKELVWQNIKNVAKYALIKYRE